MTELIFHPGLLLAAAAPLIAWLRGPARTAAIVAAPLAAMILLWRLPQGVLWRGQFLDYAVAPLQLDAAARLFGLVFALMALGGGMFALRQPNRLEIPAAYLYAGSAIGVVLAGDLITLFVFWELMAVGSTLVIWAAATHASYRASIRYLMIHLLGGAVLFAGITGHVAQTGSTLFTALTLDSAAHWLIFAGFLVNAAAPPLSAWLSDAYPEASWSGTVFLSAFTTKTAVYVLMRGFAGTDLLVWVGLFMVFYGIVYALLENDMRRILAYSIVNQVGVMVAGIGIGTEMALNGTAAHAFTHILYKALLLMSAGSVLYATGRRKCSELGGLFHSMPATTACGIVGALAISAFPLTSGFVSKSMIAQAAADSHLVTVWLLLAAASAGVFLHAGIKFPWFVFFQKDSGLRPADPPASMRAAMYLFAFLCIALGVWPQPLYALLPYEVSYEPYTAAHVLTQLQLLLFSGLAFFVVLPFLKRTATITLDADWIYRRLLAAAARRGISAYRHVASALANRVQALGRRWIAAMNRNGTRERLFDRSGSTAGMAVWVMLMLIAQLALYHLF
ncbi:MAG: Na(+)/H(+) antiporter subunit D [Burkholderiales bacterium]|nr:Na(+)/H(+) antiporter subunit D [Burkholderiales bacterium]